MSLREKINEQFNAALKNKNKTLISTLRLIMAAIKERDIANRTAEKKEAVKDPEIIKVLRKMKKQRQDSVVLYKKGERQELLEAEEAEIKIIDTFLPKQLSEEEIIALIDAAIADTNAAGMQDMGKVMSNVMPKVKGKAEGREVSEIVNFFLKKNNDSD